MPKGNLLCFLPCRIVLVPTPDDMGNLPSRLERHTHPSQGSYRVCEEHRAKTSNYIVELILR